MDGDRRRRGGPRTATLFSGREVLCLSIYLSVTSPFLGSYPASVTYALNPLGRRLTTTVEATLRVTSPALE